MLDDNFEKAFEQFLESKEYDLTEEALFFMARRGFIAGWRAAGGHVMASQPVKKAKSKYEIFEDAPSSPCPHSDVIPFLPKK